MKSFTISRRFVIDHPLFRTVLSMVGMDAYTEGHRLVLTVLEPSGHTVDGALR